MRIVPCLLFSLAIAVAATASTAASAQTLRTGSISGRVVIEGRPNYGATGVFVLPTDFPQPLFGAQMLQFSYITDADGSFSATGLADGSYLIAPTVYEVEEYVTPLPYEITIIDHTTADGEIRGFPALQVEVIDGQAVADIEIVVRVSPPTVSDPDGFVYPTPTATNGPTPQVPQLPQAGAGGSMSDSSSRFLILALIGAATCGLGLICMSVRLGRRSTDDPWL